MINIRNLIITSLLKKSGKLYMYHFAFIHIISFSHLIANMKINS